jgi:hypothetical protein
MAIRCVEEQPSVRFQLPLIDELKATDGDRLGNWDRGLRLIVVRECNQATAHDDEHNTADDITDGHDWLLSIESLSDSPLNENGPFEPKWPGWTQNGDAMTAWMAHPS